MTPQEVIKNGIPYVRYKDQVIVTERWPAPRCKCKGAGHYGLLAPKKLVNKIKLGRNDKCFCGSDKKYKKCHLEEAQRLEQSGYRILLCRCVGKAEMASNPYLDQIKEEITRISQNIKG